MVGLGLLFFFFSYIVTVVMLIEMGQVTLLKMMETWECEPAKVFRASAAPHSSAAPEALCGPGGSGLQS